jgi:hypothetical protein
VNAPFFALKCLFIAKETVGNYALTAYEGWNDSAAALKKII